MYCISVVIIFITSLLVALLKGEVAPAFAGLALTYAAQICGVFQYTIRLLSENEARFISVERIQDNIEARVTDCYVSTFNILFLSLFKYFSFCFQKLVPEGNVVTELRVPDNWPSKGGIKFEEVKLSYGGDLPDVLNDISISINGGEKIGEFNFAAAHLHRCDKLACPLKITTPVILKRSLLRNKDD